MNALHRQGHRVSASISEAACSATVSLLVLAVMSGCSSGLHAPSAAAVSVQAGTVSGRVHGGQQPVSGSAVYLFAASTTYYGSPSTSLLNTSAAGVSTDSSGRGYVTSDSAGNFSLTGRYSCPAGALVYALATGGNPGLSAGTVNPGISMMTALGPCSSLTSSTFISINELTTVATVWALAPFMQSPTAVGTSPSNLAGLTNAFAAVNELVDTSSGTLSGPALPASAVLPAAAMDTIADILAACINTNGGARGDGGPCDTLFSNTNVGTVTLSADTASAALSMAQSPALNVAALFSTVTPTGPFQPTLTAAPTDWTLAIQYKATGLSTPKALALDANSNVWIANCGSPNCTTGGVGSVTELANSGALIGNTDSGGLNIPYAIAIDLNGNAWVANNGGNSITELNPTLSPVALAFTGSGLSQPNSIAIDANGNAWLTNTNSNVLSEFSAAGLPQTPTTLSGATAPVAIAINPH